MRQNTARPLRLQPVNYNKSLDFSSRRDKEVGTRVMLRIPATPVSVSDGHPLILHSSFKKKTNMEFKCSKRLSYLHNWNYTKGDKLRYL